MKPLSVAIITLAIYMGCQVGCLGQAHRKGRLDTQGSALASLRGESTGISKTAKAAKNHRKLARKEARMERRLADPGLFAKIFLTREMVAYARSKAYNDSLASAAMVHANLPRMSVLWYPTLLHPHAARTQINTAFLESDVYRHAMPEKGYYFSVAQQWQFDSKLVAPTHSRFQPYAEFIRSRTYCNSPYTDPSARYEQLNVVVPGIAVYQRMVPTFQAGVSYWIH